MDYEKAYKELKKFCETLYDSVYCDNCGTIDQGEEDSCEDCHRKMMQWSFPRKVIENIEKE